MDTTRTRWLRSPDDARVSNDGPVIYWINRERRIADNWALLHAQHEAIARGTSLRVAFCLVPTFLDATIRQYGFMLRGIEALARDLDAHGIAFDMLLGAAPDVLPAYCERHAPSLLVTDLEPLRIKGQWVNAVRERTAVPFVQVDAHNVVPLWVASPKQEYGAYTLRPKINRLLPTYLTDFPSVVTHPMRSTPERAFDLDAAMASLRVDMTVAEVSAFVPGEAAAHTMLQNFLGRLRTYATDRNDPTKPAQSDLSPYFHYGQLAPQRAALEARNAADADPALRESVDAFLEELIVRRELADNFTYYNPDYDRFEGFHPWAQTTLNKHRADVRDHVYSPDQWERAQTHDVLWNAAQREMVTTGKMHGFMRMYWAKKLLEWTATPDEALAVGIYLNDKYELDGRDPNGYTGVAWSIGGVHDRAWVERPVYGQIRYMNANGCARKFDVKAYIARHTSPSLGL
ncbi:MAG: deoxyribodipyrimidine photo-lyase [Candidatus Kapabacteria bacterium]|nr:deoxyribodipyrimidine photo-lyase [Candidatus Kapabacteria bacterium]